MSEGKSTTIKILSGILVPDSGTCLVNEQVPWKNRNEYVRQIGVVFGQRSQLWWDIPVMDSFALLQEIYSKIAVRDFIKKINTEHKTTVILTTHDMQDIEAIANRVILIGKGQKLLDGTLEDLCFEAESEKLEGEDPETDLDHIMASLYAKLNIM